MENKIISLYIEWFIGKCPDLCTLFFKTFTWFLWFMLYHAIIEIVWATIDFSLLCPNYALVALNAFITHV